MATEAQRQNFFISPGLLSLAVDEMEAWARKLAEDIRALDADTLESAPDDLVWISGPNLLTEQGKREYIVENVLFASLVSASHKLERILKDIASKEISRLLMSGKIIRFDDASNDEVAVLFKVLGSPFDSFSSFAKVELLRDIANMYKHGIGTSSKRLYRRNPELFEREVVLPKPRTRERIIDALSNEKFDLFAGLDSSQLSFRRTGDPQSFTMNSSGAIHLISSASEFLLEMKMAAQRAAILQIVR